MIVFPAEKQEKLKTRVTWCVAYLYCNIAMLICFTILQNIPHILGKQNLLKE